MYAHVLTACTLMFVITHNMQLSNFLTLVGAMFKIQMESVFTDIKQI